MLKFQLQISMGNDAMQTEDDIITALKTVIQKMEYGFPFGIIKDINGNIVGEYEVKE